MHRPARSFQARFAQLLIAPGAPTVAEVRSLLDAMGIRIPISALAPRQSIELSK